MGVIGWSGVCRTTTRDHSWCTQQAPHAASLSVSAQVPSLYCDDDDENGFVRRPRRWSQRRATDAVSGDTLCSSLALASWLVDRTCIWMVLLLLLVAMFAMAVALAGLAVAVART